MEIAQRIGAVYAPVPEAMTILVGGSVARGYADRWSDLEVGVFWCDLPPEHSRADLAAGTGLIDWSAYPDPSLGGAAEEDGVRDGIKVDLINLDCTSVENSITAVISHGDPSLERQALLATIQDGIPLAGHSLLDSWKARVAIYPEYLRAATIRSQLIFGPHAWLEMLAERNDVLVLHDLLCQIVRTVVTILLGVNGVYARSTAPKWLLHTLAQCTILPTELDHRLDTMLRADPHTAVNAAISLIQETLTLIDKHVPAVDTTPIRQRISALPRGIAGSTRP